MALRNQAEELRRRVTELETALSEAQEESRRMAALLAETQATERRKDDFIAMLGHELRNPLAAIQAGLDLWASASPERTTWIRRVLTRQTEQLARIVDDLLDLSRITRGKVSLRMQTVELSEIVAGALASVNDLLSERGHVLEVSVQDGIRLKADPARLERILVNLLTNAARYTDEGGHICLRARQEGGQVRIEVQDNGIGLPPEMIPSLFDMFAQAGNPGDQGRGGLGIGLGLIRQLVEMHQGMIAAASGGPGKGSTFTVILPVGSIDQEARGGFDSPRSLGTPHPRRVLVVDDNQDLAVSLSFLLTESGHSVEVAFDAGKALALARVFRPEVTLLDVGLPDGKRGVDLASEFKPDVILCDLNLAGGLDGWEVASIIREGHAGQLPVLVALTAWGGDEIRHALKTSAFDFHLSKPLDIRELERLISRSQTVGAETDD